jgi:hypothetical protein
MGQYGYKKNRIFMLIQKCELTLVTKCTLKKYLIRNFEAEFKKALGRESGAQGVLFDEKTEVDNLATLSL